VKPIRAPWAVVFAVTAASALAAQQPRDNPANVASGTAVVAGQVLTRDAESRPLRKSIVTLRSDDGRVWRTAITDDGGAFAFAGLPAGRYGLEASRRGWPSISYGASRPHQRGTRIEVGNGQRVDDIVIRMPRGAVLTGSMVDHTGRPLAHAPVVALRFMYVNGERRLSRYREDHTDDRGIFRLYGLAAGEYFVASAGVPMAFSDVDVIHPTGEVDVRRAREAELRGSRVDALPWTTVGYAPVYFPGTPFRAQAMLVTVAAGEERSALDFEVVPAQVLNVQGMVSPPRGLGVRNVAVVLRATVDEAAGGYAGDDRRTVARPDGSFVFSSVPPGAYDLFARVVQDDGTVLWAASALTVAGDHAPRVLMSLRPALTLSGRVAFEGESLPEASAIRIALQELPAGEAVAASVDRSGDFVIDGLVPGRYRVAASIGGARQAPGWSVKSFVINGGETLEAIVDLRSSSAGAVVTFTDRYATLSGTVQTSAGRAARQHFVVVFPADPRLWVRLSRRIHAVRPFSDGRYLVDDLAPGEYFLTAIGDVEDGEWLDRTVLQRLAAVALQIEVSEGERLVKDLRVE
jgi:Carboxypeptidase regulatory-like domain